MKTIKTLVKIIVIFLVTVTNVNAIAITQADPDDTWRPSLAYYLMGGDNDEVDKTVITEEALVNNWGKEGYVGQFFVPSVPCYVKTDYILSDAFLMDNWFWVCINHPSVENLKIELTFESWAERCVKPYYNELIGKYTGVEERPLDIYLISSDTKIELMDKPEDMHVATVMDKSEWTRHTVDITAVMLNYINKTDKKKTIIVFGGAPAGGTVRKVKINYFYQINPDYNKTDKQTTAVNEVMSINANNDVYYDLSGKKITTPVKGRMYIKNGKLAIFK